MYLYNKNYVLVFRFFKKHIDLTINNNFFFTINFFYLNAIDKSYTPILENIIKQFFCYSCLKIKFLGKGYKIKKISTNSYKFVFNRAHLTILFFNNSFLKKIKKRKIHIKFIGYSFLYKLTNTIKKIRYVSTYTRRGLRFAKQLVYKRKGKRK